MTIYDRIRFLCKERNMSVRKLEQALGLGISSIGKWNKSSPSLNALQKIADYFNVSLDYLAGNSEYRTCQEEFSAMRNTDSYQKEIGLIEHGTGGDMHKRLENILLYVGQNRGTILFDGEVMDERTEDLFAISLENLVENTQRKFIVKKDTDK